MKNLNFTDKKLYVFGVGVGYMTDVSTGNVLYWSDKFQEANTNFSASDNVLNAGMGNGAQIIIPTDPNVAVNVTAADYSQYVKRVSAGGTFTAGAPVPECRRIKATETTLALDDGARTPVAGAGMQNPVCYVQEVGSASSVAFGGTAYPINPSTGVISGFTAEIGKTYLVSYFAARPNASMTTITTNIKGKVVRFCFVRPVYTEYNKAKNTGKLYGWLVETVPRLQLNAEGASNSGGQSAYTTTAISGRGLSAEPTEIESKCGKCKTVGNPMLYRVLIPCNKTDGIEGIVGIIGGSMEVEIGRGFQLTPSVVVNGVLTSDIPPSDFSYSSSDPEYVSVSATGYVTALEPGISRIAVFYTVPGTGKTYVDICEVTAAISGTTLTFNLTSDLTVDLYLTLNANRSISIDWDDGSNSVYTGTPITTTTDGVTTVSGYAVHATHVYGGSGEYDVFLETEPGVTWSMGTTLNGTDYSLLDTAYYGANHPELTGIVLDSRVRLDRYGALVKCTGLTGIEIPPTIKEIGDSVFSGCTGLETIILKGNNKFFGIAAFNGCSAITRVDAQNLTAWLTYSFASTLSATPFTNASTYLYFNGVAVTHINFPDTGIKIPDYSFAGLKTITEVTVPSSVQGGSAGAFTGCTGIQSVYCDDIDVWAARSWSGTGSVPTYCGANLYENGVLVTDVVLQSGITKIGDYCFYGCASIKSITLPNSVTEIGAGAFGTSTLKSIVIPDGVTVIGTSAFSHCESLELSALPPYLGEIKQYTFQYTKLSISTIPGTVTKIGVSAFGHCTKITEITIPSTVDQIMSYAFDGCTGIVNAEIAAKQLTSGKHFLNCTGLRKVWLRDTVETIGSNNGQWSPFYGESSSCVLYIEAASAPAGWGSYYDVRSGTTSANYQRLSKVYSQTTKPW